MKYVPAKCSNPAEVNHFMVVDGFRYRLEEPHPVPEGDMIPQCVKAEVCCNGFQKSANLLATFNAAWEQALLERAKAIGTTALFGSSLLPDWKRLMPDDTDTLRKILGFAEKRAVVPQDHADLANWYKKYLNIEITENKYEALV